MSDVYDVAQICLNGHVINLCARIEPAFSQRFCDRCGAATITRCQKCDDHIPGAYIGGGGYDAGSFSVPAFCSNCGAPYPWTEKRLEAARELVAELEGLTEDEKAALAKDLDDIIADTPKTTVAATRWKKALLKAGREAGHAFRDILIDMASETAKRILWPQG